MEKSRIPFFYWDSSRANFLSKVGQNLDILIVLYRKSRTKFRFIDTKSYTTTRKRAYLYISTPLLCRVMTLASLFFIFVHCSVFPLKKNYVLLINFIFKMASWFFIFIWRRFFNNYLNCLLLLVINYLIDTVL